MKQLLQTGTLFALLLLTGLTGCLAYAQSPNKFSYQAIVRDADGELVINNDVGVRISIIQNSAEGNTVYAETHIKLTNANGLVNLIVGEGDTETGDFQEIDWAEGPYFIKTEADPQGGTQFTVTTTNQMLSVPYALYAEQSGTPGPPGEDGTGIDDVEDNEDGTFTFHFTDGSSFTTPDLTGPEGSFPPGDLVGEIKFWDGEEWTSIAPGEQGQSLTFCDGIPVWGPCEEDDPGTVSDIDGNVYETVIINNQEWMTSNLRTTRYRDGSDIITGLGNNDWSNTSAGAYAVYPHDGGITEDDVEGIDTPEEMAAAYGKLYNWYAINDERNICPEGWHIPTNDDWDALVDYVIDQGHSNESNDPNGVGNALKSCRQVDSPHGDECDTEEHPRWGADDTHSGLDIFGYQAIPGGYRSPWGNYSSVDALGSYWAADEGSSSSAWYRVFNISNGRVYANDLSKNFGYLVRCVREAK